MAGDEESSEDERTTELSTIAAIFPELSIDSTDPCSASIEIPISPGKPLSVRFNPPPPSVPSAALPTPPSSNDAQADRTATELTADQATPKATEVCLISHLPPLLLQVTLPAGYPTEQAPLLRLESKSSWLSQQKLDELKDAGRTLWEDMGRDQVVFAYIDYLQQAAEDGFGLEIDRGKGLELSQDLEIVLLDFDLKAKRAKFERETFECGVCLEPKKGSACHRLLLCSHVFCVACLQDFFNSCIEEGDIINVKCLAPNCGKDSEATATKKRRKKADRTLDPSELLQIPLEQETVQRYVKLKRKKMLESDRTTIYCPRQWCQGAARSKKYPKPSDKAQAGESEDEDEATSPLPAYDPNSSDSKLPPPSERLAVCEDCSFAFCIVCGSGWHGEFAPCFPRKQHELSAEEKASEDYLKSHSTACPTCDARCQKTHGCNHMICFRCNTHFCYLCSSWLDEGNPYQHFNTPWKPCYQRLWELEEGDGIDPARFRPVEDFDEEEGDEDDEDGDHPGLAPPDDALAPPPPPPPPPAPPPPPQRRQPARGVRVNPRVQQGLARPRPMPNVLERGPPVQGLQRFLQMVENDEEDEWDSDELDESDDGNWEIPVR